MGTEASELMSEEPFACGAVTVKVIDRQLLVSLLSLVWPKLSAPTHSGRRVAVRDVAKLQKTTPAPTAANLGQAKHVTGPCTSTGYGAPESSATCRAGRLQGQFLLTVLT